MADDVPVYRSQAAAPNVGSLSIAPVQVGDLHSGEGFSQGAQELGQALTRYAVAKKAAEDETRANTAMTGFLTNLDQAETEAAQSPDYVKAPVDFRAKAAELERQALDAANLDPAERAKFGLGARQHTLASTGRVDTAALGKHVDAAGAVRGQMALRLSNAAAMATSDLERRAMTDQQLGAIDRDVSAGLLAADRGEAEKQAFLKSIDDQTIRQMIRTDPVKAQAALADPGRWKNFSGSELETYRAGAETAADQFQKDHLLGLATGSKPEQASLAMNKVLSPQHADAIYYNGIVPITGGSPSTGKSGFLSTLLRVESGGRNIPNIHEGTSSGQAQGFFQITTGTWKEFAGRAGVDLAKYPNALSAPYGVQAQVAGIIPLGRWDPKTLNVLRSAGYSLNTGATLAQNVAANGGGMAGDEGSLARWRSNLAAFDGNIALGAAAQIGGVDKAKEWQARAFEKFGPDATPLEIAGEITDKPTHDFVMQLFGHMAVPPTGPGISPGTRYQTQAALQSVIDRQQTEAERIIKEQAAMDRATGGDDMDAMKKGIVPWSPQFQTIYQHNVAAAAAGSPEAAAFVTDANTGQEAAPSTAAAWRMPPPQLADEVTRLGAAAATGQASHAELVQLAAFKAVQKEIGDNYKTDPVGVGARAGLYQAEALDPNAAADDAGFLRALAVRGLQATRAEAVYNTLAPFRPREVDALKQRFAEATAEEKLALLNAFSQTLGDRAYKAAIDQLGLDPATATAGRFAPDDQALAKKILIGESYKKVPGAEKVGNTLTAAANDAIGGNIYPPGSPALADVLTAVENVYLANRGQNALFAPPDATAMKAAVTEVVGELVTIGGRQVPATPGITAGRFEELFDHLDDKQLATIGRAVNPRVPGLNQVVDVAGRHVSAEEITAGHAVLTQKVPRGSEYFVGDAAGNGYFHEDGSPLVLDFRVLDATAAHTDAAAASAAAARLSLRQREAAAATAAAELTRARGPGALFGDQPLGRFDVPPPAAAPAAPAPAAPAIGPAPSVQLPPPVPGEPMSAFSAVPRIEP